MRQRAGFFDPRLLPRFLAILFLACAALARADTSVPLREVHVAGHGLKVEVAASEAQRERGLMFRESMPPDHGMLFIFDEPGYYAMWMKNTLIPLSVAYLDREGVILNILEMEPQTLESHLAAGPALYAIEANKGWFERHRVKAGDKVTGLPGKG
jgi:hypothetical protein